MITPVMADLLEEQLDASIANENIRADCFGLSLWKLGEETESDAVVWSYVYESGLYKNVTQFEHR